MRGDRFEVGRWRVRVRDYISERGKRREGVRDARENERASEPGRRSRVDRAEASELTFIINSPIPV